MKGFTVMKNLKVSAKLLIGFGVAAAFTLIVGFVSIEELGRLNKDYADGVKTVIADNAKNPTTAAALNNFEEKGTALYKRSLYRTAALLFVSVGVSLFLGIYISGSIGKPLRAVAGMITEIGKGHLGDRLNLNREDEIGVV